MTDQAVFVAPASKPNRIVFILCCVVLAFFVIAFANLLVVVSPKLMVFGLLGITLIGFAFLSGFPKEVLLFGWIFSLTYNRQYWSFESIVGDHGTMGPYWILSDAFLMLLLIYWVVERVWQRKVEPPRGHSVFVWFVPFVAVSFISVFTASRPDWAWYEFLRIIKIALICLYFRYNMNPRMWWAAVLSLGLAASAQALFGVLEVVSGRSGILWIIGLGSELEAIPERFKEESFYGFVRGIGTMAHPPNLACYLLIVTPIYTTVFLASRHMWYRRITFVIAGVCLAGLACTLSRWAIAVMFVQLAGLVLVLVLSRLLVVTRGLGIAILAVFALVLVGSFYSTLIYERINSDFDRSVDFRMDGYKLSMNMLVDNPYFGVGLNNYAAHMAEYGDENAWAITDESQDLATDQLHVRYRAGPSSTYFLLAAETGVLGIVSFGIFMFGMMINGFRAVRETSETIKLVCLGMLFSVASVFLQQVIDYSLLVDPLLYTFFLVAILLATAPALFGKTPIGESSYGSAIYPRRRNPVTVSGSKAQNNVYRSMVS